MRSTTPQEWADLLDDADRRAAPAVEPLAEARLQEGVAQDEPAGGEKQDDLVAVEPGGVVAEEEVVEAKAPAVRGIIGISEATFYVHGGKISYYPSKNSFEAVCGNKDHKRCVLTRTSKGRAARGGKVVAGEAMWFPDVLVGCC